MSTANDEAWNKFFKQSGALQTIERAGIIQVSADQLKAYREPRLMAKLDTNSERPQIFKQNNINILPVQNGVYILFRDAENKLYFPFESALDNLPIEQYTSKVDMQSYESFQGGAALSSESQVIDFAFISSLLHNFCGCEAMQLTIRGRLFSGNFDIGLPMRKRITVSNVQIEVDSGYESDDSIFLFEAKIGRRTDFNIRQLVYPYFQWQKRSTKRIRPIFLTYSNGQYLLTEFAVGDTFGDITIVSNRAFIINDSPVAIIDPASRLRSIAVCSEPEDIPFPQADDMDKIADLVRLLERGLGTRSGIADYFEFEERQADYYANAAAYLGLARRNRQAGGFELTDTGRTFLNIQARTQRTRVIFDCLLQRPSMRSAIELLKQRNFDLAQIKRSELESIIVSQTGVSPTANTLARRAGTVRTWLQWLLKNSSFKGANN